MNSIRFRLLLGISICLIAVFAASGLLLYVYLHNVLQANFDATLLQRASVFAKTTEHRKDGVLEFEFLEAKLSEYWPSDKAEYYQVWAKSGDTVGRSPSLGQNNLPVELPLRLSPLFRDLTLPDGRPGRIVYVSFAPHVEAGESTAEYVMAMATSRTELDFAFASVIKGLFLAGIALILGAFPTVWWSVRRALVSLEQLGEQTSSIKAENLSFRFSTEGSPSELLPICRRLNSLLERLEAAFNRERRFTADAAHEFRTPIAELRTLAEVGLEECVRSAPAMCDYFEDALAIARHLESLVTTLLALTRCEAGLQKISAKATDLRKVVQEVWSSHESMASAKNMAAKFEMASPAIVRSDEGLLRAILVNVFSNSVAHSPSGGEICVDLKNGSGGPTLTISNPSLELSKPDLPHLFEPFWRKNPGRSDMEHCGVGLSLVAAYATILGITIDASIPTPGIFQISLHWPVQ